MEGRRTLQFPKAPWGGVLSRGVELQLLHASAEPANRHVTLVCFYMFELLV